MIAMNTEGLDHALRPYLLLLMKLILESPIQRGRNVIPYEEVMFALENDTIHRTSGIGLQSDDSLKCGQSSHVAMVTVKIEPRKYKTVVNWIINLLKYSKFTAERVRTVASKMHDRISEAKEDPLFVVTNILNFIIYSQESNVRVSTILSHQKFLAALLKNLDNYYKRATILSDLNAIRDFLIKGENLSIHIATNISEHAKNNVNLSKFWRRICSAEIENFTNELRVIPDWKQMNFKLGLKDVCTGAVIGMGSAENGIMLHVVNSIDNYNSPDLPALMLHLQYLSQWDGPLKRIRGQGLAYATQLFSQPSMGLIFLVLFRSPHLIAGFREAKQLIQTHLKDRSWNESLLESARSSLICEVVEREKNVGGMVSQGLSFSYRQVPSNYNRMLVERINRVTRRQLNCAGEKYISKLFSTAARTSIVCHPDQVEEITEGFASMNIVLSGASSLDQSILNN